MEVSGKMTGAPSMTRPPGLTLSVFGAIVATALLLIVGATAGYALAFSRSRSNADELARVETQLSTLSLAHETLQERNWLLFEENERLTAALGNPDTSAESTASSQMEDGVFADGVYVVGRDIDPGRYDGEVVGGYGYWARLKSTTGMVSSIIANDIVRGPFVVDVNPSDTAIELRGVVIRREEPQGP